MAVGESEIDSGGEVRGRIAAWLPPFEGPLSWLPADKFDAFEHLEVVHGKHALDAGRPDEARTACEG